MGALVREFNYVLVWLAHCLVYGAFLPTLYGLDKGQSSGPCHGSGS
jgi:hypothetical protein